ncbi:MAG: C-terminal binding protein [Chloroflexi bacterium]|nr:C-terminal binding protein [Chloroflexota bacterium]
MAFKAIDILGISLLQDYSKMFKDAGLDIELVVNPCSLQATEQEIITAAKDADAVIAQASYQAMTRKVLTSLKKCRLITSVGIGYENLDVNTATELGIMAANVPDANIEDVSDHTMGLILACTRRIVHLNNAVKKGLWTSVASPHMIGEIWPHLSRLRGQTLGLIAFGKIPRALAPKAKGFGLRIIVCDPYLSPDIIRKFDVEQVDMDQLLRESDIVSIHTPLTPETKHILGLKELKKMKPTACLINTARGGVVDPRALYTALTKGYIDMAAFDVTEPEPIPADSPLLKLDNFIVTAHSAGLSPQSLTEMQRRPGEEIIRVVKGGWPVGLINPEVKVKYRKKWALV